MGDTQIDVAKIKFSSTVFPTDEDRKLWDALSPEEQQAVIIAAEETGFHTVRLRSPGRSTSTVMP